MFKFLGGVSGQLLFWDFEVIVNFPLMPNYPVREELVRVRQDTGNVSVNSVDDKNNQAQSSLQNGGNQDQEGGNQHQEGGKQDQEGREDGNSN